MNKLLPALFSIFSIGLGACVPYCNQEIWGYSPGEFSQYTLEEIKTTSKGISYDPSMQNIDPELIDRLTDYVENCLRNQFPDGKLPQDVLEKSLCEKSSISYPIDRKSFFVKIANDCVPSCSDPKQYVLPTPVMAGIQGCLNKGEVPDTNCKCRWRGGISCNNGLTIIACPSFSIYEDNLIRALFTCQNPWASALAACSNPLIF